MSDNPKKSDQEILEDLGKQLPAGFVFVRKDHLQLLLQEHKEMKTDLEDFKDLIKGLVDDTGLAEMTKGMDGKTSIGLGNIMLFAPMITALLKYFTNPVNKEKFSYFIKKYSQDAQDRLEQKRIEG